MVQFVIFQFTISLSVDAADRFAEITQDLISIEDYLSENYNFFILTMLKLLL